MSSGSTCRFSAAQSESVEPHSTVKQRVNVHPTESLCFIIDYISLKMLLLWTILFFIL